MKTARLIVADSEHDANMLYATGLFVPDPFIFFAVGGKKYAVMSDLEIDRARRAADVDVVVPMRDYLDKLKRAGNPKPRLGDVLRLVLQEHKIKAVEVPHNFPLGLARKLRAIRVAAQQEPFFPARTIKSAAEVRRIQDALHLAEEGMLAAIDALKSCRIGKDGYLYRQKNRITAADIQGVINATIAGLGGHASRTIVAGGNQGCDPHEIGHGPLRAHQTIILDIFPRDSRTGYWGDITRTVVRGRASDAVKKLYATVQRGQQLGFERLRAGVDGKDVHDAIHAFFKASGYETGLHKGRMRGFFHGTGHGLGLEIHELPRVGGINETLQAGNVVTVEPGLYYPGIGGVRLEDVALIQAKGCRNLTAFPKFLEI